MAAPKIEIVILNYNTKNILAQCLPNVVKNSVYPNTSIVVVDNASKDDSNEYVRTHFPEIELIEFSENYGFAGGYNKALEHRNADYFILLNSDAEPAENWLEPLMKLAENTPKFGAAQPKIIDYNNRTKFEYAGASGGYLDRYGFPFCRGRIFGNVEKDQGQYNKTQEVFWATGAALLVSAEAWEKAGGLDPDFFAHMEEIDLCWRMKTLGYSIFVCPESTVFHIGGATLSNQNPKKTYLNFRNSLLMLYKNLPNEAIGKKIIQRKLFDGLAAMFFLMQGKPKHVVQIWKAHKYFEKHKSKFIQSKQRVPLETLSGVLPESLVFGYFFRGKKTWSDWYKNQ
jgi:GT2 family glycosyltransferase